MPDPSGQEYDYDEENRLVTVKRASDDATLLAIAYDAVGRRVLTIDYVGPGHPCTGSTGILPVWTRHVYAGLETLEEHRCCAAAAPNGGCADQDGFGLAGEFVLAREFVWGDRFPQPVALVTHGGTYGGVGGASVPPGTSVYHYLHDVLGSVVALVDAGDPQANPPIPARVVERYTYDPYGRTIVEATDPQTGAPLTDPQRGAPTARLAASAFGNPFAWTGQRYDPGVKLYHFLFRGYSPHLGRWLQRDPLGYVDGPSLYLFGSASPTRYVDPFGLNGWDWVQGGLDAAGFIPFVGIGADVLNAGISGARGNWGDAAINLAAAVPGAGDAVKGVKMAAKAADAAAAAAKAADAAKAAENAADAAKAAASTTPDGRPLSHHYETETGPQRNIPGSVADDTIKNNPGVKTTDGKTVYYDPGNDVTVVVGTDGRIVSAHPGKPRKDQLPNNCPKQQPVDSESPAPGDGQVGPPAPLSDGGNQVKPLAPPSH